MSRYLSRTITLIVVCCFSLATVAGCAMPQVAKEHPTAAGAAAGGLVGGAAGGAIGGVLGGTKGAIIGAVTGTVAGALAGAAIGHYAAKRALSRDETAQEAKYEASQGNYVRMTAIEIEPSETEPGGTIKINFIYALLTPDPEAKMLVEESRSITYNGEEVGTVTFAKEHTNGTWKTTVPLALPSQAEAGTYMVKGAVKAGSETATDTTTFQVQKKI